MARGQRMAGVPTWDEPVTGFDAESIASLYVDRFMPKASVEETTKAVNALVGVMLEALAYGSGQVRDRFLSPQLRTVLLGKNGIGQFWECRFCQASVPAGSKPDEMEHRPGCHLLTRGNAPDVETGRMDDGPAAKILRGR